MKARDVCEFMPRFFLHYCDGQEWTRDESGIAFDDAEAARAEAIRSARSMMAENVQEGHLRLAPFIEIEDEERRPLFRIPFGACVQVEY